MISDCSIEIHNIIITMCNFLHADIKDDLDLNARLKEYESDLDFVANVPFALEHFSYNNSRVLELVYGYLNQTNFSGITVGYI